VSAVPGVSDPDLIFVFFKEESARKKKERTNSLRVDQKERKKKRKVYIMMNDVNIVTFMDKKKNVLNAIIRSGGGSMPQREKIYSTNITEPGPVPDTVGLGRPFSILSKRRPPTTSVYSKHTHTHTHK
jgi:hypothetical protein